MFVDLSEKSLSAQQQNVSRGFNTCDMYRGNQDNRILFFQENHKATAYKKLFLL